MQVNDKLTVVIPTLDEAEAIGIVIKELKEMGVNNILVVDGYSQDGTPDIAKRMGAKVIFQEGKGKADAIRTALKHVDTPFMLIMDGDYTYPAKEIPNLLRKALKERYDEVIGARLKGRENIPLINRLGNRILTTTFNMIFGTNLSDVCSGMYLVKTSLLKELGVESKGFNIEVEIAAIIASMGGKIGEIPIEYRKRIGTKKLRIWHGLSIFLEILRLAIKYNPVFLVFTMGSLLLIPGFAIASWVIYKLLFLGIKHHVWALVSVMMSTTGLLSLMLAILSLYMKRLELRIRGQLEQIRRLLEKYTMKEKA